MLMLNNKATEEAVESALECNPASTHTHTETHRNTNKGETGSTIFNSVDLDVNAFHQQHQHHHHHNLLTEILTESINYGCFWQCSNVTEIFHSLSLPLSLSLSLEG